MYRNKTSDENGLLLYRMLIRSQVATFDIWVVLYFEAGNTRRASNKLKAVTVQEVKNSA